MANPTRLSLIALVGSARPVDIGSLTSFIAKHINLAVSFRVLVTRWGPPRFELELHLPFYYWSNSRLFDRDERKGADGNPLRVGLDISFLEPQPLRMSVKNSPVLYAAQISCLISGSSDSDWKAYCLVDSYIDAKGHEDFHIDDEDVENHNIRPDPLTRCRSDLNMPDVNPRQYFLRVLNERLVQIALEWRELIIRLQQKIHLHVGEHESRPFFR